MDMFYSVGKHVMFTRLQDGQPGQHDLNLGRVK